MKKSEKIKIAKLIKSEGEYALLSLPFNKRLKSWFTKTGNVSKAKVSNWINKILNKNSL
jgi:hypothetical protein